MSNATLWWYPGGTGGLREVDLLDSLSADEQPHELMGAGAAGPIGAWTRVVYGARRGVRITVANFADAALARELKSFEAHLKAGYTVTFAGHKAKAWGGFLTLLPASGDTALPVRAAHEFSAFNASAVLAIGDEVAVVAAPPDPWIEWCAVTGFLGLVYVVDAVRYDYLEEPVLLVHRDFYPALKYQGDAGADLLRSSYRRTYTFDVTLWEDHQALAALYDEGAEQLGGSGWTAGQVGTTTDAIVDGFLTDGFAGKQP